MGIRLPAATRSEDLQNPAFMGKVLNDAQTTPSSGAVTNDSFQDRGGNTIIGRASNTAGKPADIGLGPNQFLANRAGTVVGTTIQDSDIPAGIARDAEVSASFTSHTSAPDPHPGYLTVIEADLAYQPLAAALTNQFRGTGSPEGVVTATRGATYQRTDGGAGTCFYVKESDTTNTGWVAK